MAQDKDMAGKVAIVTGGSGGIGQATAAILLGRGAKVMLAARDEGKLDRALDELRGAGSDGARTMGPNN